MKQIIICLIFILSGCRINQSDIDRITENCSKNNGLNFIDPMGKVYYCNNGAKFHLKGESD